MLINDHRKMELPNGNFNLPAETKTLTKENFLINLINPEKLNKSIRSSNFETHEMHAELSVQNGNHKQETNSYFSTSRGGHSTPNSTINTLTENLKPSNHGTEVESIISTTCDVSLPPSTGTVVAPPSNSCSRVAFTPSKNRNAPEKTTTCNDCFKKPVLPGLSFLQMKHFKNQNKQEKQEANKIKGQQSLNHNQNTNPNHLCSIDKNVSRLQYQHLLEHFSTKEAGQNVCTNVNGQLESSQISTSSKSKEKDQNSEKILSMKEKIEKESLNRLLDNFYNPQTLCYNQKNYGDLKTSQSSKLLEKILGIQNYGSQNAAATATTDSKLDSSPIITQSKKKTNGHLKNQSKNSKNQAALPTLQTIKSEILDKKQQLLHPENECKGEIFKVLLHQNSSQMENSIVHRLDHPDMKLLDELMAHKRCHLMYHQEAKSTGSG